MLPYALSNIFFNVLGKTKDITSDDNNMKQLKRCLQDVIEAVNETITNIHLFDMDRSGTLNSNTALKNDLHTLISNKQENDLVNELQTKVECLLDDCLIHLSQTCKKYLFSFLYEYEYDSEARQFKNGFTRSILPLFEGTLRSILASFDVFPAAENGYLTVVKEFITNYSHFKDRPGLWGSTLLYTAAKNNKMNVVKYLIENAECSINIQNEQQLDNSLVTSATKNIKTNPTAGSTALHVACYNGHLDVVKYLIEHGADYFIKDQAAKCSIMTGRHHSDIQKFFQTFLISGYSTNLDMLPERPISEETKQEVDCIWEYKSFSNDKWLPFSSTASNDLQKSLIIMDDQKFQQEIFLTLETNVYSVSTVQFLRSGKDNDRENDLAWVRCRGSSILNFDCYSLWQTMFIKHKTTRLNSSSSPLKILKMADIYNRQLEIELNTWYYCSAIMSSELDKAMNYRRKNINFDLKVISGDPLMFDLEKFSFNNQEDTISGFIRWIPKLILNSEQNTNTVESIDNFSTLTNLDVIPLTTKHYKLVSQIIDPVLLVDEELLESDNEYNYMSQNLSCPVDYEVSNFDYTDQLFLLFNPLPPIEVPEELLMKQPLE
ncbi:unnamed protein product [Rotaria sordida]|uniref:Uncharacterized protein n=1 Tax=Rotaria sordida TaxID=392033 RepID=A0A815C4W9_9BILA|nr:unnamed protein product [Rotaria sordida]CAF4006569.1 unnamed protein product [Rotaria sordida]